MKKRVLIKDIAKAAGVSSALVSYVINHKEKEVRVSEATAKKIKKIAAEMNYHPNQVAKSLKSGKSFSIGLIVTDISNPFFGRLARLIENEANKEGYTVIFGSSDENAQRSQQLLDILVNRQIEGVIIVPAEGSEYQLKYLNEVHIPFILIDRYFKKIQSSYVVIDNFKATYQATEYLIKKGHSQIAFVRYKSGLQHAVDRYEGYRQALKDYGLPQDKALVCQVNYDDDKSFNKNFNNLLKRNVEAIVFSTNTLSIKGLRILKEGNITIPEDIEVFCFDENAAYDLFYHPVNYVCQPLELIAKESVKLLIEKIRGSVDGCNGIVLEPEIIIKE